MASEARQHHPPLPRDPEAGEGPVFAEPWHAQVFAMTVRLSEQGHFAWPEWATIFSAELRKAEAAGAPSDGSTYYEVWLDALERLLAERGLASEQDRAALKAAWTDAYLSTPHGHPVRLADGGACEKGASR